MTDGYATGDVDVVTSLTRTHKTDEQTRVVVLDVGDSLAVLAMDLDATGAPMDVELVDDALTPDEAEARAERWADANPKGLAGGGLLGL